MPPARVKLAPVTQAAGSPPSTWQVFETMVVASVAVNAIFTGDLTDEPVTGEVIATTGGVVSILNARDAVTLPATLLAVT